MNVLKPMVHSIYSDFNQLSKSHCKKTHLYELIASYFGHKSYAALKSKRILGYFPPNLDEEAAKTRVYDRATCLLYSPADAVLIIKLIVSHIETANFDNLFLEQFDDYLNQVDWDDFETEETIDSECIENNISAVLQTIVEKGNLSAKFVQLVWSCTILKSMDENPDYRSAKYWYNKRIGGSILSKYENEVADVYLKKEELKEVIVDIVQTMHLSKNTKGQLFPQPELIRPFMQALKNDDDLQFLPLLNDSPNSVFEAIDYLTDKDWIKSTSSLNKLQRHWLIVVFLAEPTIELLAEFVETSSHDSEKWFWYFIGLEYDLDITIDDHFAINSYTGERDWDDGPAPLEIGGYTGLILPQISEENKQETKIRVKHLLF